LWQDRVAGGQGAPLIVSGNSAAASFAAPCLRRIAARHGDALRLTGQRLA